jgi:AmiR/NasT family two-component response regulator
MGSLIIVFPRIEDAMRIRDICVRHGFEVAAVCSSAAAALKEMNRLDGGIVVCGYRLPDMFFAELRDCLPAGFEMLLVASGRALSAVEGSGVMAVSIPLSVAELTGTLAMMLRGTFRRKKKEKRGPKPRTEEEQALIDRAKALLMERNHMTESEAHRYLQKCSMDNGRSLAETAGMILALMSG